jgi:hypothetical protein
MTIMKVIITGHRIFPFSYNGFDKIFNIVYEIMFLSTEKLRFSN